MILVFSDYHRHENDVLRIIDRHQPNHILCCGDGESNIEFYDENKIISVAGNCDYANLPNIKIIEIGKYKILMTHGHLYNVIFGMDRLYYLAKEHNCNLVLYGHTHIQKMEEHDGIIFLNPGSVLDNNYAIVLEDKIFLK